MPIDRPRAATMHHASVDAACHRGSAATHHERALVAAEKPLRPSERLALLCDADSLQHIRSGAVSRAAPANAREGDGVVAALGRVAGRPIYCYAQDASFVGGSVGETHADTIVRVQRLAARARVPIVGFVESGGARMQEGLASLNGYARIFRESVAMSGDVPQISVISGTSAGGGSYSPALTDFVIMTDAARMFLTGPAVLREVIGEDIGAAELGGPRVHSRNGVCHFAVGSDVAAVEHVRQLLSYLPTNAGSPTPIRPPLDPDGEPPEEVMPISQRQVYDVRRVIRGIVDADSVLEVAPRWARNMVTAFCRLAGRAVGVIANQPNYLGGVIEIQAAQKGARFVRTCAAFGLPLVVLVDTPGFLPGRQQETGAVIRHGAKLLHAFAEAEVPRLTVVLRKAYGGAYITMNSRDLGADLSVAWTDAELGIMGPEQAVGIVNRRDLEVSADPAAERRRLAAAYRDTHLGATAAARAGHIDEVIAPNDTRQRLVASLDVHTAGGPRSGPRLRNIPL
jgi:acetyl-CoA carboxylase carboxyltransferase component